MTQEVPFRDAKKETFAHLVVKEEDSQDNKQSFFGGNKLISNLGESLFGIKQNQSGLSSQSVNIEKQESKTEAAF